jgi:hypothetical protein
MGFFNRKKKMEDQNETNDKAPESTSNAEEQPSELDKEPEAETKKEVKPRFYKGYDMVWLKKNPSHPDFSLVAEYDKEYGGL